MTKFLAQSANDLRTTDRNAGRVARKVKFIVQVEADDGSWTELDADSQAHAKILADNWVEKLNARGCSCWKVAADGKLSKHAFYHKYAEYSIDNT
jgi:hypothetical protein